MWLFLFTTMTDLKQKAIALGLCKPFQETWNDDLVGMYKQGITWCIERQYPTLADMLPYDDIMLENDVYNSKDVNLLLTGDTYILNECTGQAEINDYNVSRVYVGLNSILKIKAKDKSHLMIDCYDNSIIQLEVSGSSKVVVWQYGNSVVQVLKGNAKIIKK